MEKNKTIKVTSRNMSTKTKSSMSEIEELKEQARKERKMKAAAQAANLSYKYPDELRFNLQPQQTGDGTVLLSNTIRRALGEFRSFAKVLKGKESHLLLGLDSTVPGTPEVNDVDFENPLNGYWNDIFAKPGKNGTNNHVQQQFKKVVENAKNIPSSEFAEPKGKAEQKPILKPVAKPKPPKLDMQKPCTDEMIKNPNNIESILKEMTQPLPPALTDIETPGKGPGKMFQFPQAAQTMPVNNIDEKPTVNGGTCQEKNSTIKLEPYRNAVDSNSTFKKVEADKKRLPGVKAGDSGVKTKQRRKISTSSTSSSDDSSSESSASSESESEKVEKQAKSSTVKKTISAINSPLIQNNSPSKMHKTKSPFNNNNNYILNKENKIHTGLSYGNSYAADINLKQSSISELNGFSYVPTHMNLNNVVQDETDDSALIGNHASLFPSPMDIEKTISPLDPENLFDDLIEFPEPSNFLGGDVFLIPSKNDNDFDKVSTENLTNSRVKHSTTNLDDFTEPSLDDSFESNNLILNKLPKKGPGVLYQKDSKNNIKKSTTAIDERNKSSSKSNETKDKSKSKSTRSDSGPSVKVNSGSKGHIFRTKAELKSMPKQRRKSVSENSDKEDSKTRKSKESSYKKNSSEKAVKKEKTVKRERLKSKVNISKDVISIDKEEDKDSLNDKKPSNISSTPTQPTPTQPICTITTDTMPPSKSPVSSITQDFMPHLKSSISTIPKDVIPPVKSPNEYTVDDLKVEDKCDLFLDGKHETETGNIFDTIKNSIVNTISPMNSPECYTHVRNLMEDGTYEEPPTLVNEEIKLKEIKSEDIRSGYDMMTDEFKSSPVHKFTTCEEGNVSVNDINFGSQGNSSVNDIIFASQGISSVNDINFTPQGNSSVNDLNFTQENSAINNINFTQGNSSIHNINFTQGNSSINNINFSSQGNSSINTINFGSQANSSVSNINFSSEGNSARNNINFSSQGNSSVNDINYSSHGNDSVSDINFPSTLDQLDVKPPPILLDELNNEPSTILDHSHDIKPDNTELLIDDNPYSVKDIENIVPVSVNDQMLGNVDLLNSDRNCFDPIIDFNDTNLSKLTIKIPLHSIKLKNNKYRNRPNTCNDVQTKSNVIDTSLSSGLEDDQEIDVENDSSPLKRKRKVHTSTEKVLKCNTDDSNNKIKDVQKKLDREFETPNKEEYEKLIIRISLAKLKRAPLKGVNSSDQTSKEKRSPKVRPPKICKLNSEPPAAVVTTDVVMNEDVVIREESPVPVSNLNTPASLPPCSPAIKIEEMETENCHQNDVSQSEVLSSSEKETMKKRGRPRKEKVNAKPEVKHVPTKNSEMAEGKNCDSSDDNVCHECGTLRKDYGRDSRRISSYKSTYSTYYNEGRRRKHEADNIKIPIERAHKYTEAVLKYAQYLIGLELSGKMNVIQGVDEYMQITSECIQLVDYVITKYGRKENPASQSYDVRFTLLCLRLQSILYLKLFKVKKESAMKYSKVLSRYFKQFKAAGHAGPSPYSKPVHNRGSTGTPSPSSRSPGPSPGGSVASIGSAGSSGSAGSNDITANGVGPFVTIPTDVHEKAFQHLQYSKNLLHGHLLWEDSDSLASHCQPFLIKLSRKAGQLTMQSSMLHVVDYVTAGLEIIKELPHS